MSEMTDEYQVYAFLDRVTGPPFTRPLETADPFVLPPLELAPDAGTAVGDGTS